MSANLAILKQSAPGHPAEIKPATTDIQNVADIGTTAEKEPHAFTNMRHPTMSVKC